MKVYADHAATTRLDIDAFEAMKPYLLNEYGNASQPYSFSRSAKAALKSSRETIAMCINAEPEEIFFTSGGTESDNWAVKGSVLVRDEYRRIVTTSIEHHAVLHACAAMERLGYPVTYVDPDEHGVIQPDSLRKAISADTKLVSVMYANNEVGSIQPIKQLCSVAHATNSFFHTDAVQAVGHIPIDVKDLNVDMLSASAHKFGGPKGIGFLFIKSGTYINSYADGGAQEMGMRAGTENIASIVGMSVALKNSCERMHEASEHLAGLEKILITRLVSEGIDFRQNGHVNRTPGNISLSFRGIEGETLLHRLDLCGIAVSTGSACDSKSTQLSHVLRAIHAPSDYAYGTIRVSLGPENTTEEVEYIASSIIKTLHRLGR